MVKKQLVIRLLTEAIKKCETIVNNLRSEGWYDPPDEPDLPEECPSCGGELDYKHPDYPCIGKPCGWLSTDIQDDITNCPRCGGDLELETLHTGEDALVCKGKGCGWNCEPDVDPPDNWDF